MATTAKMYNRATVTAKTYVQLHKNVNKDKSPEAGSESLIKTIYTYTLKSGQTDLKGREGVSTKGLINIQYHPLFTKKTEESLTYQCSEKIEHENRELKKRELTALREFSKMNSDPWLK